MTGPSKPRAAWDTAIGTSLAWLIISLVNVMFWTLLVVITPFVMIRLALQRRAPGIFGNPGGIDPEDVAAFDAVWTDLCEGDIAALEEHARTNDSFPHGHDPFINRPWLTNAVHSNAPASVRWILEQGVQPDIQDDEGSSPLISAVEMCDHPPGTDNTNTVLEIITLLLDHGADPNFRVSLNRTALHAAAYRGTPEVVRYLLERGADPHVYDTDYVPARPIDDARFAKRKEIVAVIRQWMDAHPKPDV